MTGLRKILIANRGEIACRIIRTAHAMGYATVAVYSEADTDAPHRGLANQAVCIGAPAAADSYLNIEHILAAARDSGADAIHPGYGFLAENAQFARACLHAGLTFIGPDPAAIELMGSKRLAKQAMLQAGVPCIPGYQGADQSDQQLIGAATELGFPLMIKAAAGGGGRGMRLVQAAEEMPEQLRAARSEARSAFGDDEVILERALIDARHIEIQVFGDKHGNVVHLGERDCSVQRRHQKVIEEAPSPFVNAELRQRMGAAAISAAQACDYHGAGTVEFLVDAQGEFYFLEMNTRLQVEHPVTELVTGQDLVAWQLKVAAGERLPLTQEQIACSGHAIEVRLYAEDPRQNFLPQTGRVVHWREPTGAGVRVDSGISTGQTIGPHYDPLLAKLIGFGADRAIAHARVAQAVTDTRLLGVNHNGHFLQRLLAHPSFTAGRVTTDFVDDEFDTDASGPVPGPTTLAEVAVLACAGLDGAPAYRWRASAPRQYPLCLEHAGTRFELTVAADGPHYRVTTAQQDHVVELQRLDGPDATLVCDGASRAVAFALDGDELYLQSDDGQWCLRDVSLRAKRSAAIGGNGQVRASMDGSVVQVLVGKGDQVNRGQTVAVLEAMKMEHPLKAAIDGVVESVSARPGQQVKTRQLLMQIEPAQETGQA